MKIRIEELQDFDSDLKSLRAIVDTLISIHGEDCPLYFDAGYNNVDVVIITEDEL